MRQAYRNNIRKTKNRSRISVLGSLSLESLACDEALDLGGLGVRLAVLLNLAANHELADVILLGKVEKLADVVGTLGTKSSGVGDVLKLRK